MSTFDKHSADNQPAHPGRDLPPPPIDEPPGDPGPDHPPVRDPPIVPEGNPAKIA
jgi:hypothetical protein